MKRVALAVLLMACQAPTVGVEVPVEAGVDAARDDGPLRDATFTFPDGRVCSGHDEDGDGFPDGCDTCPSVADPEQRADAFGIGEACAPASLAGQLRRSLFDPMLDVSAWLTGGPAGFHYASDSPDDLVGGLAATWTKGRGYTGFAVRTETFSTTKPLVVLATLDPGGGVGGDKTGAFVRSTPGADVFIGCYVTLMGKLGVAYADACLSKTCELVDLAPTEFVNTTGWKRFTLRIVARDTDTGGTILCEAFDADAHTTDAKGVSVSAEVSADQWGSTGRAHLGLFAQNGIGVFHAMDVLVGR